MAASLETSLQPDALLQTGCMITQISDMFEMFFLSRSIAFRLRGGWCRPRGFERSLGVRALVFRAVHTIPKRRVARAPASVQCGDTAAAKNADCFPPAAILRGEVI